MKQKPLLVRVSKWALALTVIGTIAATLPAEAAQTKRTTARAGSRYSTANDWDRDGVPNWKDTTPRGRSRYSTANDLDRDGIPNWKDTTPRGRESQPNMTTALRNLRVAERELNRATLDKGGHRKEALKHVRESIQEVEKGIRFDNRNP